eukprot:CAMPEP_0185771700 /NCGR_PEP_ID=MMETSP1174-20130828/64748_1 /TAXON_ID=35687 /ORGANISM="Dictyocha speculum, Strain CCMP1381" /LENGTH=48 /DNA_ID= /DNA_START= /DNA_END= /DNA_ORIENTATION=
MTHPESRATNTNGIVNDTRTARTSSTAHANGTPHVSSTPMRGTFGTPS